jgi:Synaptobrevin
MGSWYLKGHKGYVFIVVTSSAYDKIVAVECLDDLCDTYLKTCRIWDKEKQILAQHECCKEIANSYATFEEGGLAHFLVNSIDEDVRISYSNIIQEVLVENIEKVKSEVHKNMLLQIQNMESADELEKKSAKALENAKIFKKNANELKKRVTKKNHVPLILFTTIGAAVGFLAGGPGGAIVLTKVGSVAAAQMIEAGVGAAAFGIGFIGTTSAIESWTMNQNVIHLQ